MPSATSDQPPRNGPMSRQRRSRYSAGSIGCAAAGAGASVATRARRTIEARRIPRLLPKLDRLRAMTLLTEPVGSIPRPKALIEGMAAYGAGRISSDALEALFDAAVSDTIRRFEETGSPVITDGEQRKPSFATYPVHGAKNLAPGGVTITVPRRAHATASRSSPRAPSATRRSPRRTSRERRSMPTGR